MTIRIVSMIVSLVTVGKWVTISTIPKVAVGKGVSHVRLGLGLSLPLAHVGVHVRGREARVTSYSHRVKSVMAGDSNGIVESVVEEPSAVSSVRVGLGFPLAHVGVHI